MQTNRMVRNVSDTKTSVFEASTSGLPPNFFAIVDHQARGDYDTALKYLKQALAIQQEIGDLAGLCATLFNMGHIHLHNEEVAEAINAWVHVYSIAKSTQLTQALEALESLAEQLGLPGGLEAWEQLAQQAQQRNNEPT